jgi:hypothetical protein
MKLQNTDIPKQRKQADPDIEGLVDQRRIGDLPIAQREYDEGKGEERIHARHDDFEARHRQGDAIQKRDNEGK